MPSGLFSLRLTFERSKSESLRDVTVTRIGYALSYGFPQTEYGKRNNLLTESFISIHFNLISSM